MKFTPSPEQTRFFDWVVNEEGSCILAAVAGAGKTTTLIEAVKLMSGRIWIGVFNKKLGDEIAAKIAADEDLMFSSNVFTSTFHAAGFAALRRSSPGIRVDADKCKTIAKEIIDVREGIDQLSNRRMRAAMGQVLKLVSLAKNHLIVPQSDDDEYEGFLKLIDRHDIEFPGGYQIQDALDFAQEILLQSYHKIDVIDFDDMIYIPVVNKAKTYTHDWVLVDEAQDTNPARRALARKLLTPGGRLVAVGDPHQAIYGFTGADNDALEQIAAEYSAITIPLSVTFRCPKTVVDHVRKWVDHITAHPDAIEGAVLDCREEEMIEELTDIPRGELGKYAILCRVTKHLVRICYGFLRRGIPAKIEGRSIGQGLITLAHRWKVTDLNDLDDRLQDYESREIRQALEADNESLAERVKDQVDTLRTLIIVTQRNGGHTVSALVETIESMFDDNVSGENILTLCTSHRAKGLEWNHVYLLGREELMPSPWARQAWMQDQERNLIYVSITRALTTLTEVTLKSRPIDA